MKRTRKVLVGLAAAAGLATATAIGYAQTAESGPGQGPCPYGGPGAGMMSGAWGGGPMGPGMMGGGGGGGPMGPGMMGGGGGGGPMGPGMMGRGGESRGGFGPGAGAGPVARVDARLAFLKTELKITPDQEAAWQAYATQVKQQAETMQALRERFRTAPQSAPESLDQRAEFTKQRAENMQAVSVAVKNLYVVLTPEQKAIADRYFGGMHMSQFNPRGRAR